MVCLRRSPILNTTASVWLSLLSPTHILMGNPTQREAIFYSIYGNKYLCTYTLEKIKDMDSKVKAGGSKSMIRLFNTLESSQSGVGIWKSYLFCYFFSIPTIPVQNITSWRRCCSLDDFQVPGKLIRTNPTSVPNH